MAVGRVGSTPTPGTKYHIGFDHRKEPAGSGVEVGLHQAQSAKGRGMGFAWIFGEMGRLPAGAG